MQEATGHAEAGAARHDSAEEWPLPRDTSVPAGEWKVVTVLCCGLGKATTASGPEEPERRYRQMHMLYTLTRDAVQRYGGTLQPVVGEYMLGVFGAPMAQEEHAQHAALAAVHKTGARYYEAELYRLKGELLLTQEGKKPTAQGKGQQLEKPEPCFRQALEVARRQQAKALELRAAMSLSRLWQRQGKQEQARQLLTPIYHSFTEGFDTADLQEAKALLGELC
jgi:hypothetical protein